MGDENTSRRTSLETSNPNVFSDDFAVDGAESIGDVSPVDSIDSRPEQLNLSRGDNDQNNPREYTLPGLPETAVGLGRISISNRTIPADASAGPQRAVSTSSPSIADTRRTLSTSSRFSIPRAQSPYQGPTAPSQPYGLYPQVTRASSITSESTVRPVEQPFIAQGGPEHPYSMYPQNTVPEEDDHSDSHIVLGFPGMGHSYPTGTNSSGDEVGDIVGSDGHVEQLPPYSRYADNVIAKGDMGRLDPQTTPISQDSAAESTLQPDPGSGSDVELTAVGSNPESAEIARKEGMSEKRRRRMCCGVPLWTVLVILAVVVVSGVLGGVIGGIVGNKKGADRVLASAATTTVWLDADPAQTGPATPTCPTGHYTIPLNQTEEINSCIVDSQYASTWSCLNFARLGINVFESANGGPPLSVVFDDYSVRPQLFKYGPQPPDFNGTAFTMQPYKDKEDGDLGVALFFSVLFDKLSILHAEELSPPNDSKKRSVPASHLKERGGTQWTSDYLNIGDQPWYCFWNSTINEFWIFLDQDMDDTSSPSSSQSSSPSSSSSSPITSAANAATSYTASPSTSTPPKYGSGSTSINPSQTQPYPSEPTDYGYPSKSKRQAPNVGSSNFPKLVKMVEKRKPDQNVQPYCQQMQVLNNWQIMPIPTVPTICIEEDEFGAAATANSGNKIKRGDTVQQLGSNCVCEWFSV